MKKTEIAGSRIYCAENLFNSEVHFSAQLLKEITRKIGELAESGAAEFLFGLTGELEFLMAYQALRMKKKFPYLQVRCMIPYMGYENRWGEEWSSFFKEILSEADEIRCFYSRPVFSDFAEQKQWLQENATHILTVKNQKLVFYSSKKAP